MSRITWPNAGTPCTVTVVDPWAVPPAPWAVAVYVVVVLGVTLVEPLAGNAPSPGMLTEVALVVVQLRTAVAPLAIVLGLALKEIVGGGICDDVTVTVAGNATVPPGPVAVAV